MNLIRWDPIREMDQFLNRPLSSFMGRWQRSTNDVLTIEGERTFNKVEKSEKVYRRESSRGMCSRSLSLPDSANSGAIRAESKDDFLTVHLPKKTKSERAKPIEIKVQ